MDRNNGNDDHDDDDDEVKSRRKNPLRIQLKAVVEGKCHKNYTTQEAEKAKQTRKQLLF